MISRLEVVNLKVDDQQILSSLPLTHRMSKSPRALGLGGFGPISFNF
jgi:hypothetical protein